MKHMLKHRYTCNMIGVENEIDGTHRTRKLKHTVLGKVQEMSEFWSISTAMLVAWGVGSCIILPCGLDSTCFR